MAHVSEISWHVTPFRAQRWIDRWEPAAAKATEYGATDWAIYRSEEDPLLFRQVSTWENKSDFEAWWFSEEVSETREAVIDLFDKPLLPKWLAPVISG
ncbi:MAG: hypothetical protein M9938_09775 [Solirubrobacterales bacterium]|nr:hypothetical protein [Solirubrobacterales bacterium]